MKVLKKSLFLIAILVTNLSIILNSNQSMAKSTSQKDHPELTAKYGMKSLNTSPKLSFEKGSKGKINVTIRDEVGIYSIKEKNGSTNKESTKTMKNRATKEYKTTFSAPGKNKKITMFYTVKDVSGLTSKVTCIAKNKNNKYSFDLNMRETFSYGNGKLNLILKENGGINKGKASIELIDINNNKTVKKALTKDLKFSATTKDNGKIIQGLYSIDIKKLTKDKDGNYKVKVKTTDCNNNSGEVMAKFTIEDTNKVSNTKSKKQSSAQQNSKKQSSAQQNSKKVINTQTKTGQKNNSNVSNPNERKKESITSDSANISKYNNTTTGKANFSINTTPESYATDLSQAIEYANSGNTITLLNSLTDNSKVTINKNIILNMNGKNLNKTGEDIVINKNCFFSITGSGDIALSRTKVNGPPFITNKGTLNLSNSGKISTNEREYEIRGDVLIYNSGTVNKDGTGTIERISDIIYNNGGKVTIQNGTLSSKGTLITNVNNGSAVLGGGKLVFAGNEDLPVVYHNSLNSVMVSGANVSGKIENISNGKIIMTKGNISNIYQRNSGTIKISGGQVRNIGNWEPGDRASGTVEITGGQVGSIHSEGNVNIKGGKITPDGITLYGNSILNLTGGTIERRKLSGQAGSSEGSLVLYDKSKAIINGGTISMYSKKDDYFGYGGSGIYMNTKDGGSLVVKKGAIKSPKAQFGIYIKSGKLKISGGTVSASEAGINIDNDAKKGKTIVEISGGKITGRFGISTYGSFDKLTIKKGANIKGKKQKGIKVRGDIWWYGSAPKNFKSYYKFKKDSNFWQIKY